MLLDFSFSNYKSFLEKTVFSMVPAPKQTGLDYSILKEKIGRKLYKGLSSAVIYGPNAAGKSNIIGALDTFKSIVLRGHIRNDDSITANPSSVRLELIPNNELTKAKPIAFEINFIAELLQIKYCLEIDIGKFLETDATRSVVREELYVNKDLIFKRLGKDSIELGNFDRYSRYVGARFSENAEYALSLAQDNLKADELFLTNGFKSIISQKLASVIVDWFERKLMVVYHADKIQFFPSRNSAAGFSETFTQAQSLAAEAFGVTANSLTYDTDENKTPKLVSEVKAGNTTVTLPSDVFESYGTLRFVNIFPVLLRTLQTGGTLVVDEFDASIHPMAIMSLVNIFHNDEINVNHAQLVFNTHNPIFLDSNLYRRDEIKFVERDDITHLSKHYSLSDFSTAGKHSVRKNTDYMKNYFINHYGAIKDIDFAPVFEALLNRKGEEHTN